ncbi:MAG: hypothetical protein IE914_07780 [Thiotrichales bacterium]|nr:hypothetical protein [Thiotrichales bacterium]
MSDAFLAYRARLLGLLAESYLHYQQSQGRTAVNQDFIRGFMEAGLVAGVVTRESLENMIDEAHKSVFGISFKQRENPGLDAAEELFDIPTWIRRKAQAKV